MIKYIGEFEKLKELGFRKSKGVYRKGSLEIFVETKYTECFDGEIGFRNVREVAMYGCSSGYDGDYWGEVGEDTMTLLAKLSSENLIQQVKTDKMYVVRDDGYKIIDICKNKKLAEAIVTERDNKIENWCKQHNKCYKCEYKEFYEGDIINESNAPECFNKCYTNRYITMTSSVCFYGLGIGEYGATQGSRPVPKYCICHNAEEIKPCHYKKYYIDEVYVEKVEKE